MDNSINEDSTVKSTDLNNITFGPILPLHLMKKNVQLKTMPSNSNNTKLSEDEDELMIGPLPDSICRTSAEMELSQRALEIKLKNIDDKNSNTIKQTREEWMMELPDVGIKAGSGIIARSFQTKERPDFSDRTCWTETPKDKSTKKKTTKEKNKKSYDIERDKEQESIAKKHKKKHKRNKSLLEIHEKKKKKNKSKSEEKQERRPFNRDSDIQVNRFDQTKKQALIKSAKLLDTKFSSGNIKYL